MQGSDVLIDYAVDPKTFKIVEIFYASDLIREQLVERFESAGWEGIEQLVYAARYSGAVGKSLATPVLEAFC